MHTWGDEGVDWQGIGEAARYIAHFLRRWGRVGVRDYKEKWGTVRVYCSLGWHQFHCITHPGHCYSRYPKWLWRWDVYHGSRLIPFLTGWAILPYHRWLYRLAYKRAVAKWPHLKEEITSAADYPELLEGL